MPERTLNSLDASLSHKNNEGKKKGKEKKNILLRVWVIAIESLFPSYLNAY